MKNGRIVVREGIVGEIGTRIRRMEGMSDSAAVISDTNVFRRYGQRTLTLLRRAGFRTCAVVLPAGESSKSLYRLETVYRRLARFGLDRSSSIVALGGGVVGDIAGFVASTYMRGVPLFQVPTTFLAQIDAAIGGKTAVDLPEGKNLVGTFYQPAATFIDPRVLRTLPDRRFREGIAEAVKYGVACDANLFRYLQRNADALRARDRRVLRHTIERCAAIKTEIVRRDERDVKGIRAVLNFGHTVGHAIEAVGRYRRMTHGEAVAVGMAAEAEIARDLGLLPAADAADIRALLRAFGLPVTLPRGPVAGILRAMAVDKKNLRGVMRFALPVRIGRAVFPIAVPAKSA